MRARTALAVLLVVLAAVAGGLGALSAWSQQKRLGSIGTIVLSVSPFHQGALDVYVPLVDWGVRFGGPRVPARLQVDVRTVDRDTAARVASGERPSIRLVRAGARDAIAGYLRVLALVVALAALGLGALVALALRRPRLIGAAGAVALLWIGLVAFLLAPRGSLQRDPEFYAHGAEIPVALRAVETAGTSAERLSQTTDEQLVGLARIVRAPADRPSLAGAPSLVVASDLHNNLLALPTLRNAARGAPVLFPGDLTDRGSRLEAVAVRQVVSAGHPFVFSAGNHDSDTLERRLARAGAIVLTRRGRLRANGTHGPRVVRVAGLRVAGYDSPNMRRAAERYHDRGAKITAADQEAFRRWLLPLADRVDVVLVHEPSLAAPAVAELRNRRRVAPLLVAEGHTHAQAVGVRDEIATVNGGTLGAGGTGNLTESRPLGLATVTFRRGPFRLGSAGLVEVDPGSGDSTARRVRLDGGPVELGDPGASSPEGG